MLAQLHIIKETKKGMCKREHPNTTSQKTTASAAGGYMPVIVTPFYVVVYAK
jgi:hypothetical protein